MARRKTEPCVCGHKAGSHYHAESGYEDCRFCKCRSYFNAFAAAILTGDITTEMLFPGGKVPV